jgi:Carboxypeptidase regulatory-like domain/TonB dependent receptor
MAKKVDLKSAVTSWVICIVVFLVAAPVAFSQFTSGFSGVVVEQSGAAVPSAKVTVTNQATRVSETSTSSESGVFRISSLAEGIYTVEIEGKGFKAWTQTDVHLESNEQKTLYPTLALPTQVTTVEVSGAVAAVETDKTDTSRELSEASIDNAPLVGRNIYTSMIELAPGITGSGLPSGGALGSGSANNDSFEQEAGYQINAAGQRQESNEYDVDGSGLNSASRDGVVNLSPEPDFIEAVTISGATIDASKGRYSGAYVQVFTKPGTNSLHGSASEYFTNDSLTSRTIFQTCGAGQTSCDPIAAFERNEFGGTIGGPIVKNKLFVFGGVFRLLSSNGTTDTTYVETPQFVQFVEQNFPNNVASTFFSKAPPAVVPTSGILDAAQVEQATPGFFSSAAFPATLPVEGIATFPESLPHDAYQWHFRVDYNLNESKDRLFFDIFRTHEDQLQQDPRTIYRVTLPNAGFYAKLDWTHAFSTSILNDAGFTVVRAVGSNPGTAHNQDLPNVNITGADGFSQWGPAGWVHENFNWHDVLTWTHGAHTISAGVDIDRHHDDDNFTVGELRPTFGFANLLDFAQDKPYSQSGPALDVADNSLASNLYNVVRWVYLGGFVQDNWKVNKRLSLNLGLRYDYFGHWGNFHNSTIDNPMFTPGSGSDFAEQITNGTMTNKGGSEAYVTQNRPQGISPRIGFGWDVFGNGKMSVRGGYGLFYNNVADGSWSFPSRANPPTWADPSFNLSSSSAPFSYGLGSSNGLVWPFPQGPPLQSNAAGGIVGLPVLTSGVQPNVSQPRTNLWMLSVQKDIGHNLVAEVDYNGSESSDLYVQTDVNRFPGDLIINRGAQTRLNANFGPIIFGRTIGDAAGHYGTLMLTKKMNHAWQLRGIYTFGKSTDEMSSNDNGTNNGETVFNPLDVSSQHGLSDFDVSRRFTADSMVLLPSHFTSGFGKALLGGWRSSTILVLQSGVPFTVYTSAAFNPIFGPGGNVIGVNPGSGDYNADGYDYDAPNRPSTGSVNTGNRSDFIKGFAAASSFPVPALGQEGNLGRNPYIGPGLANVNEQFSKAFTFERFSIEVRADIFNLFNRVNLGAPISDLSSGLFGQSTSQSLPRSFQFGVHFSF